nr:unknown [Zea mays]
MYFLCNDTDCDEM